MKLLRILAVLACTASCSSPAPSSDASSDAAVDHDVMLVADGSHDVVDAADAPDVADASPVTTTLRVHYPAGSHTIAVRGSLAPLDWSHGLATTSMGSDTFVFTTTQITAPIEWKPLLDDSTWSRGPNYHATPGATVDVYPHFMVTAGQVITLFSDFHSTVLDNDRAVYAYLPPTYVENTDARFPVLYMQDGQNLFDPTLAFGGNEWQVDESFDAAAENGSIREAIVIGPANTSQRIYEYTPTVDSSVGDGGGADRYLTMLITELKPQVDAMLRTLPGPENTGLMGSSLGGLLASYGGLQHPETFGLIGSMSPSTWWDNEVIIHDVMASAGAPMHAARVYVDSGDSGTDNDDVTYTNMLAQTYLSVGYHDGVDFEHVVQAGGMHNEIYWAMRFPGAAAFLLGPRGN